MTPTLRFIGDVHGQDRGFFALTDGADFIVQVGDLGLNYGSFRAICPDRCRVVAGNHDNYDRHSLDYFRKQPYFLGDFGTWDFAGKTPPFFYMRGAWSIDHQFRVYDARRGLPPTWWPEEELDGTEIDHAVDCYASRKPEMVVTHEAPHRILEMITDPRFPLNFGFPAGVIETRTAVGLDRMLSLHRPKLWVFGHHHRRWEETVDGTRFICLDMIRGRSPNQNRDCFFDIFG